MSIPAMGMLPGGKERVGEHEGREGYLGWSRLGSGMAGVGAQCEQQLGGYAGGVPARGRPVEVGEDEGDSAELRTGSNQMESGRREGIDVHPELRSELSW